MKTVAKTSMRALNQWGRGSLRASGPLTTSYSASVHRFIATSYLEWQPMEILTATGWRPLRRMLWADLREASRRLPLGSRDAIADLAGEIHGQKFSPGGGLQPPPGLGPTAWNSEAG